MPWMDKASGDRNHADSYARALWTPSVPLPVGRAGARRERVENSRLVGVERSGLLGAAHKDHRTEQKDADRHLTHQLPPRPAAGGFFIAASQCS
jgi:hypothetical protein